MKLINQFFKTLINLVFTLILLFAFCQQLTYLCLYYFLGGTSEPLLNLSYESSSFAKKIFPLGASALYEVSELKPSSQYIWDVGSHRVDDEVCWSQYKSTYCDDAFSSLLREFSVLWITISILFICNNSSASSTDYKKDHIK